MLAISDPVEYWNRQLGPGSPSFLPMIAASYSLGFKVRVDYLVHLLLSNSIESPLLFEIDSMRAEPHESKDPLLVPLFSELGVPIPDRGRAGILVVRELAQAAQVAGQDLADFAIEAWPFYEKLDEPIHPSLTFLLSALEIDDGPPYDGWKAEVAAKVRLEVQALIDGDELD